MKSKILWPFKYKRREIEDSTEPTVGVRSAAFKLKFTKTHLLVLT